jgi:hypothetical protein
MRVLGFMRRWMRVHRSRNKGYMSLMNGWILVLKVKLCFGRVWKKVLERIRSGLIRIKMN